MAICLFCFITRIKASIYEQERQGQVNEQETTEGRCTYDAGAGVTRESSEAKLPQNSILDWPHEIKTKFSSWNLGFFMSHMCLSEIEQPSVFYIEKDVI